jgi:light-regulated signal transduction histidine kinase (bacteriophytochrome)
LANKDLESFAYSVSHDLRAPLRGIQGFSHILIDRHLESLDDEGKQYINYILQASTQMESLINDLLQYSRLGRKAVQYTNIDILPIIEAVLADLATLINDTEAKIILPQSYPIIRGDKTLLIQIFLNLIQNALTYNKPNLPPQIQISWRQESEYAIIQVADNGIGISEEFHGKIFTMFQRLHSEDNYPGTGIGLALVKKAVELLNGDVWVESDINQGSTFWVKLPVAKKSKIEQTR